MAFLAHETNSFSPIATSLQSFEEAGVYRPQMGPPAQHMPLLKGVGDFYREAQKAGDTAIVGSCALAQPSAPCCQRDYEALRDELLTQLRDAGPVDMVLLMMHGAMMAEGYDDCEGDALRRVRALVGDDVAVGVLLDLHCNMTDDMLTAADILMPCREYPHTDFAESAAELYRLTTLTAKKAIRPTVYFHPVPMLGLFPTVSPVMQSMLHTLHAQEKDGVLSARLTHGFPWADFEQTGAGVLLYVDSNAVVAATAQQTLRSLAEQFFALREQAQSRVQSLQQLLAAMPTAHPGTVVIADMADNPGGGAASDATFVLQAFLQAGIRDALFGLFWDIETLEKAWQAGVGAQITVQLGGKQGVFSGNSLPLEVCVQALSEQGLQPHIADGTMVSLGRAAVLSVQGICIVVNEIRQQPFHPQAFESLGLSPWQFRSIVVKSSYHFHANFSAQAAAVLYVDTPGLLNSNPCDRPYQRMRRPVWPLDALTELPSC